MSLIEAARKRLAQAEQRRLEEEACAANTRRTNEQAATQTITKLVTGLGDIPGHKIIQKGSSFTIVPKGKKSDKPIAGGGGWYSREFEHDGDGGGEYTDNYYYQQTLRFYDEKGETIYSTCSENTFAEELIKRLGL